MERSLVQEIGAYYEFWYALNGVYADWARAHGISVHTLSVLDVLREEGAECSLGRICERLQLPKQTVHSVLTALIRAGYVVRRPAQNDRRVRHLALTEAGQAYAAQYLEPLYAWEKRAFARMDAAERAAMTAANDKLVHLLREEAAR